MKVKIVFLYPCKRSKEYGEVQTETGNRILGEVTGTVPS